GEPRAVEDHLDLAVLPLDELVGAVIPDGDAAATVLAARDLPVELGVLKRVILGVHGQVVDGGIVGDALGQRPGDEDAVALQPEVPVQPAGVVLLDDEDPARSPLAGLAARGSALRDGAFGGPGWRHRLRGAGG